MVAFGNVVEAFLCSLCASLIAVSSFCFLLFIPSDKITVSTEGIGFNFSSTPQMCLKVAPGNCQSVNLGTYEQEIWPHLCLQLLNLYQFTSTSF